MEARSVIVEECLHVGNMENTLVIAGNCVIPHHRATLFYNSADSVHIDDIVADVLHKMFQNALVDAREALCILQIFNLHIIKALAQPCLVLYETGNLIQTVTVIGLEPVGHQVIAVGLMWCGNKTVQSDQKLGTYGSSGGCQHNVCCQTSEVNIVTLGISGGLRHHNPKGILGAIFCEILIDAVAAQFKRLTEDCADNTCRLRILQTTDGCHDCQMQLRGCGDIMCHRRHALAALDAVEKLTIALHHTAHSGIVR